MRRFLSLILLSMAVGWQAHAQDSKFWGFLSQSESWSTPYGVYSYQSTRPFDKTALFTTSDFVLNAGCAWLNGVYYGMYYTPGGWFTSPSATLYKINTETWKTEGDPVNLTLPDQINFVAIETAHASDGTTWGEFRTADDNTYELGTVDYANMTRTTLATTTRYYLALGISSDGFLYGVDTAGDLYRISTSSGEEKLVGNTGIKIADENTDPKSCSTCGEIDPLTNEFYWPYYSGVYGDSVTMYKIDLATAAATKVGTLPDGDQIVGMVFPTMQAPDGAPAPASNITFDFDGAALAGKVSFTAPDTTASGEPLGGGLNYTLAANDSTYHGTVAPGAAVVVDVAAPKAGMLNVKVTLSNDKGSSLPVSASRWLGYDVPQQPRQVKATLQDDTVTRIEWSAPDKGVHDGFLEGMTYDVCRIVGNDSTVIAAGISSLSAKDTVRTGGYLKVTYGVRAHNHELEGAYGYSDVLLVKNAYAVPFEDKFDENTKRDYFTTIDANHDGITIFRHYSPAQWGGLIPEKDYHEMGYTASGATLKADDWFISPKIYLEAGVIYKFAVDARSSSLLNNDKQIMEVAMGTEASADAMTRRVMTPFTVSSVEAHTFVKEFTVERSGTYYMGIHVLTDPGMESLYFTNIHIDIATNPEAPDSVSHFAVEADPTGLLQAKVSFKAPTTTNAGHQLSEISRVEILRNNEVIDTETGIAPGQEVTYVDNSPANGYNSYFAVAYNDQGNGRRSEADTVYVGVDVPMPPKGLTIKDTGNGFSFAWNPVDTVGKNGWIVRPQDVSYSLRLLDDSYDYKEDISDTQDLYADYAIATDEGAQDLIRFGLVANNNAGESDYAYARTLVGAPYNLPYSESFATGIGHGINWMEGDGVFAITTSESSDQDAGCVAYTPESDGETTSFNLGKMNMQTAVHPRLSFMLRHLLKEECVVVKVALPDGTECAVDTIYGRDGSDEWESDTVALDAFAGGRYIIPKFVVTANSGHSVLLDKIVIRDPYDTDLALDIDAPDTVQVGSPATVRLRVTNVGLKPVSNYRVDVLQGATLVATAKGMGMLKPGESDTLVVSPMIEGYDGESVLLKAQLFCPNDVYDGNDIATYVVVAHVDGTTGLHALSASHSHPVDVYALDGKLVRAKATSLKGLPQGIYLVGGRKVQVK